MNLETFETAITPKIAKVLSDGEAYRQKCYLANREWQLRKFNIGWDESWSHAELIHALHKKLQTLRKNARRAFDEAFCDTQTLPMFDRVLDQLLSE